MVCMYVRVRHILMAVINITVSINYNYNAAAVGAFHKGVIVWGTSDWITQWARDRALIKVVK